MPQPCARAHTYIREFSKENGLPCKLEVKLNGAISAARLTVCPIFCLGIKKEKTAVTFSSAAALSAGVDACRKRGVY